MCACGGGEKEKGGGGRVLFIGKQTRAAGKGGKHPKHKGEKEEVDLKEGEKGWRRTTCKDG